MHNQVIEYGLVGAVVVAVCVVGGVGFVGLIVWLSGKFGKRPGRLRRHVRAWRRE